MNHSENPSRGHSSTSGLNGEVSPSSAWFVSNFGQDDDNLLDYFLNGSDNAVGTLPPTPEGEPLPNESIAMAAPSTVPFQQTNEASTNNAPIISHQFQHQQQPKQRNHIRFSIDQNHNRKNSEAKITIRTPSPVNEIQPPPTPVVQHFYARPPSTTSASSHQKRNQQQHHQLHQQAQHSLNNLNIHDVSQFHVRPLQQDTRRAQGLYSSAVQHQQSSSMIHSKSQATSIAASAAIPQISFQTTSLSSSQPHQLQVPQHSVGQQQPQREVSSRSSSQSSHENFTNLSPISPAMICTSEMMMLPPPPISYNGMHSAKNNGNTSDDLRQQQQPNWQHIPQPTTQQAAVDDKKNKEQIQNQLAQTSWLQRVQSIAMNTMGHSPILPAGTNDTVNRPSEPQQGSNINVTENSTSQIGKQAYFTPNGVTQPIIANTTLQQQQQSQPQTISQPQQFFITTMSHPSNGGTINTDILPIPTVTNPTAITAALHHLNTASLTSSTTTVVESKEKRERRLARNRESARQSRRRKKELLINLEAQVNRLNANIERERRRQLTCMETELLAAKSVLLREAASQFDINAEDVKRKLELAIRGGSPNIATRRAAAEFQYNSLRQLILPYYQRFFLAMSLYDEDFFTGAKEKRSKENKGSGRISSKIVGEEIHKGSSSSRSKEKSSKSCNADDKDKLWPLLCYELTISLDQEERLLQAFRRTRDDTSMPQNRSNVSVAVTMVSSLRNGTLFQSHSATHRNVIGLLDTLTPQQTVAFMKWFANNKDRCSKLFGLERKSVNIPSIQKVENSSSVGDGSGLKTSDSLTDICNQLTEALKIAKTEL